MQCLDLALEALVLASRSHPTLNAYQESWQHWIEVWQGAEVCKEFLITSLLIIFQYAYQSARIVTRELGLPTHCLQDALRQWGDATKAYSDWMWSQRRPALPTVVVAHNTRVSPSDIMICISFNRFLGEGVCEAW